MKKGFQSALGGQYELRIEDRFPSAVEVKGRLIDEDTESQPKLPESATPPGEPEGGGGAPE